jgi:hypothetical protein
MPALQSYNYRGPGLLLRLEMTLGALTGTPTRFPGLRSRGSDLAEPRVRPALHGDELPIYPVEVVHVDVDFPVLVAQCDFGCLLGRTNSLLRARTVVLVVAVRSNIDRHCLPPGCQRHLFITVPACVMWPTRNSLGKKSHA